MEGRRVTRNAWSRNKSNLALKRQKLDIDSFSDDDEIAIDLSEPEKILPDLTSVKNQRKPELVSNRAKVCQIVTKGALHDGGRESFQSKPSKQLPENQAIPVDENATEDSETNGQKDNVDISEVVLSAPDLCEVGHFLETSVTRCDPKSIWASQRVARNIEKRMGNNPAQKRLEKLERMVKKKLGKGSLDANVNMDSVSPPEDLVVGANLEVSHNERKTNKGCFRANVDLKTYQRIDFSSYEEVIAHVKHMEEEHGVRWNKIGNSVDFKLSLDEYVSKYADKIIKRQRLVYYANTTFPIAYFGSPYMCIEESIRLCEYGMNRKYKYEPKRKDLVETPGEPTSVPLKTKKVACTAEICVRKILVFRKIRIPENTEYQRNLASRKVREILKGWSSLGKKVELLKKSLGAEIIYVCWSPKEEAHDVEHPMKDQRIKPVLPEIIDFIRHTTENGVTVGSLMEKCVEQFVRENYPEATVPENLGKRPWWPDMRKIRNVMEGWIAKKKIARIPRRKNPGQETTKRPYKRRGTCDPTRTPKRRKKGETLNVTGDVWLDEYGELVYNLDDYQAHEVVVTTDGPKHEEGDYVEYTYYDTEVVTDQDQEIITDHDVNEEFVYTEELGEDRTIQDVGDFPVGEFSSGEQFTSSDFPAIGEYPSEQGTVIEIVKPGPNTRDPGAYEARLNEAQNKIRDLVRELTGLSYNVGELTALEFAQRYLTDAIELLKEHADQSESSDIENMDPEVQSDDVMHEEQVIGEPRDLSQGVVWVSVDSHSNVLRTVDPPLAKLEGKADSASGDFEAEMEYSEGDFVEATKTLKVISLPPPNRQGQSLNLPFHSSGELHLQ